mgnify:FL=1
MAYIEVVDRKKPYVVVYYVNGKKRRKSFSNKKDAQKFKKQVEAEKELGELKDRSNIRFKDYAPLVFELRDKNASAQTKQNRSIYLKKLIEKYGNWKLAEITPVKIKKAFVELSNQYSNQVMLKIKQIFNIVFDSATEDEIMEYNPLTRIKYKISQKNIKKVNAANIYDIILYLYYAKQNFKYYLAIMLVYYTGMRIGEALALSLDDFNFEKNIIIINKSLQRNMEIGPTKTKKERKYPIIEEIAELYYEALYWHNENKKIYGDKYQDNRLFIAHEDGSPVSYNALKKYLERIDKKIGRKMRPHQIRHWYATMLRGMDPKDIGELRGWQDADTMLNVYQEHDGFRDETIMQLQQKYKSINIREKLEMLKENQN